MHKRVIQLGFFILNLSLPAIALVELHTTPLNVADPLGRVTVAKMEQERKSELKSEAQERERMQKSADRKSREIVALVQKAITFIKKKPLDVVCRDFIQDLAWRIGEIFIYVIDSKGTILCYGDESELIWKNIAIAGNRQVMTLLERIAAVAPKGGWVNYQWHNGDQFAYAQQVEKNGVIYYCLAGFYPESKEYDTRILVDNAARLFEKAGIDVVTRQANNRFGPFVKGEMTVSIYNEKGDLLSDPENTGFIGQNVLKTFTGSNNIIKQGQVIASGEAGEGWFTYPMNNAQFRIYVRRVTDPETKKRYAISSGYYPNIGPNEVVSFVHKAIDHLKSIGAKEAFSDFNNAVGEFVQGPLTIYVYDFDGINLADGTNPSFVGKNLLDRKDPEGLFITQKMIKLATEYGKGSFSYLDRNDYKVRYFEAIEVPDGKFIIGSSYFPSSKVQTIESIVSKGFTYLLDHPITQALREFNNPRGEFWRGDIYLFVYTLDGTALVNGLQRDLIWRNFMQLTDDQGKSMIQDLLNVGRAGGGWLKYLTRNAERQIYVRLVTKQDPITKQEVQLILGSGFYL